MKHCTRCVLPDTHESIKFDEEEFAMYVVKLKQTHTNIDWQARGKMLDDLCNKYRGTGNYDCIVPFSGGKDSAFQLWYIVTQLHMKQI